ncbi:MAG: J domain-containing protein [Thermomicrobiales bacterium]|nr:J domain-containing protein [Thermomicrobiales bacterium]
MSMQLVPITIQVDLECALLAFQIRDAQQELMRLQRELAPLETAFGLFEQKVASQSAGITAERNRLRKRCLQIEHYTNRLHARLLADPDGHLSDIFTPNELRAIGELFGIDVPEEWFGTESRTTTSAGAWEWADDPQLEQPAETLPHDDMDELRTLYRQLAKAFHPDLASDTEEHLFRAEMMLRINHAWHTHDLQAMRDLHSGSRQLLDIGTNRTRVWQLQQLRRDLEQIMQRCTGARTRLQSLRRSRTRALWYDSALANAAIARHLRKLEAEIAQLQERESLATEEFRQAFGQYAARS